MLYDIPVAVDVKIVSYLCYVLYNAQIPLHTFPRNFPVDGEVAKLLRTC